MTEGQAILALPRFRSQVYGELLAADKWRSALRDIAADFYAYQLPRPFYRHPDGTIETFGVPAVELPTELTSALRDAEIKVAELQHELANCVR